MPSGRLQINLEPSHTKQLYLDFYKTLLKAVPKFLFQSLHNLDLQYLISNWCLSSTLSLKNSLSKAKPYLRTFIYEMYIYILFIYYKFYVQLDWLTYCFDLHTAYNLNSCPHSYLLSLEIFAFTVHLAQKLFQNTQPHTHRINWWINIIEKSP